MATAFKKVADNAISTTATVLTSTGVTSITVATGDGAKFPAAPFYVTLWTGASTSSDPGSDANMEIVTCTAKSGDVLTISATTKTHAATVNVGNLDTAEEITDLQTAVNNIENGTTNPGYVLKAGDTMTGALTLNADPSANLGAATKQYVDNKANNSSFVKNEVPGGLVNGSNTAFTTASNMATGSLSVYRNGIRLKGGGVDFTQGSNNAFTMVTAPNTGDLLLVDYNVSSTGFSVGTNSTISSEAPSGTIDGSNTTFTLSRAYIAGSLEVYIDGIHQRRTTDYTETTPGSGVFTMAAAPLSGQTVYCNYQFNLNPSSNADTVDGIHASSTATAGQLMPLNSNAVFGAALLALVKQRQGGTTGDASWQTAGTSNTDTSSKAVKIQTGVITTTGTTTNLTNGWYSTGTQAVTFPEAFTHTPIVFVTSVSDHAVASVAGTGATTTGFSCRGWTPTSVAATVTIQWIAIGQ